MKNIFLIALLTIAIGCGSGADKPDDLLSETEMVSILSDVHILEAKLSRLRVKNDSLRKIYNSFEKELLAKHGTNKVAYEQSYEYYMASPEIMEKIYEIVVDSLNVKEQEATMAKTKDDERKAEEKELKRAGKDSLIRANNMKEPVAKKKSAKPAKPEEN